MWCKYARISSVYRMQNYDKIRMFKMQNSKCRTDSFSLQFNEDCANSLDDVFFNYSKLS